MVYQKVELINGNIVLTFKSIPKWFGLEQEGIKPYTIRDIDKDERFEVLKVFYEDLQKLNIFEDYTDLKYKVFIRIVNTEDNFQFRRRLKFVYYNEHKQVISNW